MDKYNFFPCCFYSIGAEYELYINFLKFYLKNYVSRFVILIYKKPFAYLIDKRVGLE